MIINSNGSSSTFARSSLGLDPEGQLALLVLENEQTQSDAARQDKSLARQRYVEAANDQVAAMHEEASHVWVGALVHGACTLTASTIQLGDIALKPELDPITEKPLPEEPWGEVVSAGFSGMAPVLGKAVGDEPAGHDRAEAKAASSLEQLAEWQLDDANKVLDDAKKAQDKALDWLAAVNANQASTETGIIAGFA